MLEPISTLSNLAFIIFGMIVFKRSWYVGIITMVLGVASGGWHWTLQPFWHTFDFAMMYFMLLSLINHAVKSGYTLTAFLSSIGMIGLHFLVPSNMIIISIAIILLLALVRSYQPGRVFIIVACFTLWISTNIPYLHQWSFTFWVLDLFHGISHVCAAIGIYKTVSYKPTTFFELTKAFKSYYLPTLQGANRANFERIIDAELIPALGDRPVDAINQQDISRLADKIALKEKGRAVANEMNHMIHQIFEFGSGRGIKHNLATH